MNPLNPPDPVLPVLLDALEQRRAITIVLADDLGGFHGRTHMDSSTIFLDAGNTAGEMRATVLHELLHLLRPDATEEAIEHTAAELLVPASAAAAAHAGGTIEYLANQLVVDPKLVRARLRASEAELNEAMAG